MTVRLAVRRLLEEAGLEVVEEQGLYVALWRSSADGWLPSRGMRPLTPQTLGSHAVLVALHPESMEAVLGVEGEKLLWLIVDNAVLAPDACRYHLANCYGNPRLPVVVGTRRGTDGGHQEPARGVAAVEEDKARSTSESTAQEAAQTTATW